MEYAVRACDQIGTIRVKLCQGCTEMIVDRRTLEDALLDSSFLSTLEILDLQND